MATSRNGGRAAPTCTATSGSTGRRASCCCTAGPSRCRARNVFDIRLMAALWSSAIAIVIGLLLTYVAGRRAGAAAALLSGLLSTAPVIEGFTANGELMATLPGAHRTRADRALAGARRPRAMFAAGLFAGGAVLVKQSGYDGGLAAGLWLLLAVWRGWQPPEKRCARSGHWPWASR